MKLNRFKKGVHNEHLKKSICKLIICSVLAGGIIPAIQPVHVYAATAKEATASVQENMSPLSFKERVQKIVDEYNNKTKENKHISYEDYGDKKDNSLKLKEKIGEEKNAVVAQPVVPNTSVYSKSHRVYNFDWQGVPLTKVLYGISKIAGKRVVINGSLSGQVYATLPNVSYEQALSYLAKTNGFNWMLDDDGEAILISTGDVMLQSKRFDIHNADKIKVREELISLGIEEKNIYANDEYGTISVTGTPYLISQAAKRIKEMDKQVSQCLIVAQLIEISHGKDVDLGLKYSLPTYTHEKDDNLKGNFIEKLTFSASMDAEKSLSKGRVVARPMILTKNGKAADVYFGDRVPVLTSTSTSTSTDITVEYKDVGSTMKVAPYIDEDSGEISLNIDLEMSNISKWITQGNVSAPQIASRQTTTSAHLKSGQSFVIGGLMTSNELDNLSGIPGLMNLPILGKLFSYHNTSKTNTEVFIMITPYIISSDTNPTAILREVVNIDE